MKKIIAFAVLAIMVVSMCVPAFADGAPTITFESATIEAGETAELSCLIDNNPGVAGLNILLSYDKSIFTIGKIVKGSSDFGTVQKGTVTAGNKFTWANAENDDTDGVYFTVPVTVAAGTPAGDYPITVSAVQIKDEDLNTITDQFTCVSSVITVPAAGPAVTVSENATINEDSKVSANLYFALDAAENAADYTVAIGNAAPVAFTALDNDANGYKLSIDKEAKKMGEAISYVIYKNGTPVADGTTSVKAYAEALIANDAVSADVKAAASAMLAYGAAAQTYFGYDTANLVSNEKVTTPVAAQSYADSGNKAALKSALFQAKAPVEFAAINATFDADTTLMIAFQAKDATAVKAAKAWVDANVVVAGATTATTTMHGGVNEFVVLKITGIAIEDVLTGYDISVAGIDAGSISVANYLAAAETSNNANFKGMTRALYAYAVAIDAIA